MVNIYFNNGKRDQSNSRKYASMHLNLLFELYLLIYPKNVECIFDMH